MVIQRPSAKWPQPCVFARRFRSWRRWRRATLPARISGWRGNDHEPPSSRIDSAAAVALSGRALSVGENGDTGGDFRGRQHYNGGGFKPSCASIVARLWGGLAGDDH